MPKSNDVLMTVRMPAELRAVAQEKARLEGRTTSDVVREFLMDWVALPPGEPPRRRIKTWRDK